MDKNTRITYAIFATQHGKGYLCSGIKHEKGSKDYLVSLSFCNPLDEREFSKPAARKAAVERLDVDEWRVSINSETHDFDTIIREAIKKSKKSPNWALKALKRGNFSHTLCNDWLKAADLEYVLQHQEVELLNSSK